EGKLRPIANFEPFGHRTRSGRNLLEVWAGHPLGQDPDLEGNDEHPEERPKLDRRLRREETTQLTLAIRHTARPNKRVSHCVYLHIANAWKRNSACRLGRRRQRTDASPVSNPTCVPERRLVIDAMCMQHTEHIAPWRSQLKWNQHLAKVSSI